MPRSGQESSMAARSGRSEAVIFGMISPKIRTITVIAAVEIAAAEFSLMRPVSERSRIKSWVAIVDDARLTRLLPIRIVVRARS